MHAFESGASACTSTQTAVIDHAKDFGFREFASQRYHYSRSYAGTRNYELGRVASVRARLPALAPLMA